MLIFRSRVAARLVGLALSALTAFACVVPCSIAAEPPTKPIPARRVFSAGHSFHFFMPPILTEVCALAKIEGHKQVGEQALGGSQVLSHWNLETAKNTVRPALEKGEIDVLTVSPLYLPDAGIEKCWTTPGRSQNRMSTYSTFSSLICLKMSSADLCFAT